MKQRPNETGRVIERLPNMEFRVHIDGTPEGKLLRCILSGKMKISKFNLFIGDKVEVVHTPEMGPIGRIVWKR